MTAAPPFLPQPGDFGLARGSGLAMAVVRFGTLSRYGHACVCEYTKDGRIGIIEPMPTGCRQRVATPDEFVWSTVALTEEQRVRIVRYCIECIGIPYDWPAIAAFIPRVWGARITGRSDDHADDKLMCSEMVVWAFRRAGKDLARGRAPGDVSPGMLRQFLDDQTRA